MKTAGIIADNYKVDEFKRILNEKGYKILSTAPFKGNTTVIKVEYHDIEQNKLHKLIENIDKLVKSKN